MKLRNMIHTLLGWLHCGLIFSPYYALVLTVIFFQEESIGARAVEFHLRGLLIIVPVALSWFAGRYLKHVLLYIPAAAAITALSAYLFGHPLLAVPAAFICFLRFYNRVTHEGHSLLDHAGYPGLAIIAVPAGISVFEHQFSSAFQTMGFVYLALYFLICFAQRGIRRIRDYVSVNEGVHNFPARRITRLLSVTLALVLAVTAIVLLPPLLMNREELRITMPTRENSGVVEPEAPAETNHDAPPSEGDMLSGLDVEPNPVISAVMELLEYLIFAGAAVLLVVGAVAGAVYISRSFRSSYRDREDLVENLQDDQVESLFLQRRKRSDRPRFFDRSPNAVIRRRWRKAILKAAKEPPRPSFSPAEAEAYAGLSGESAAYLHLVYEKARYSEFGATKEDI